MAVLKFLTQLELLLGVGSGAVTVRAKGGFFSAAEMTKPRFRRRTRSFHFLKTSGGVSWPFSNVAVRNKRSPLFTPDSRATTFSQKPGPGRRRGVEE